MPLRDAYVITEQSIAASFVPARRWIPRSLGFAATVVVHLLLVTPMVLGVAEHKRRTPDGDGTVASASYGEQYERMILLDLAAIAASEADTPAPSIDSEGIAPDEIEIQLVSSDPQPPPELKAEDMEEAETANEAAGDPAGHAALFGKYMGQVSARIERAWMRPRSPIAGGRFECRVRITQDVRGNVQSIELQSCGADETWRKSLTSAILQASPLSAPPEPALFTPTLTLNFSGDQYVANQSPEYAYEPVIVRASMAPRPVALFREESETDPRPAVLDGAGDVQLTIVGGEVRWTRTEPAAANSR
jgi:hypothetical protein